jgi:hypothetical protein
MRWLRFPNVLLCGLLLVGVCGMTNQASAIDKNIEWDGRGLANFENFRLGARDAFGAQRIYFDLAFMQRPPCSTMAVWYATISQQGVVHLPRIGKGLLQIVTPNMSSYLSISMVEFDEAQTIRFWLTCDPAGMPSLRSLGFPYPPVTSGW